MASGARRDANQAARGRGGRPRLEHAGEVDVRLLEAAAELFLAHGFERTSCEDVAARARAGKASLYARYPNKAALFAAAVRFEQQRALPASPVVPPGLPVTGRLAVVAREMLAHAMTPSSLAFMRLVIAEGQHLPDVAREAARVARQHAVARVAEAMVGEDPCATEARARALPAAALFVDLVFVPEQMRALLGESAADAGAESADTRIATAIRMLDKLELLSAWR